MKSTRDKLTVQLVGQKARSKTELYRLLTTESKIYLPP